MASSKSSPGPHDRDPNAARKRCIRQTRLGKRCTRWATSGSSLCAGHLADVVPDPSKADQVRGGKASVIKRNASKFVLNEQSRTALRRLGVEVRGSDPKQTLMETVASAHRQRQVWESMLAAIPEEDWAHLGEVPIPGLGSSAVGARIEAIQKFLGEATKTASRASKLAIDAGIEERLVRLAEDQANMIADTVRAGVVAAIGSLHLSPAAEAKAIDQALGASATHLRALAAGDGEIIDVSPTNARMPALTEGQS